MSSPTQTDEFRKTLITEAESYGVSLSADALTRLSDYYALLSLWNSRMHLVAPCTPQEFATRHILESLIVLKYLPEGSYVAELGAGAGLPILPCLIVRRDLRAVLIDGAQKKAVFLREALNKTSTSKQATVIGERFEGVKTPAVRFVTCRALERFEEMLPHVLEWAPAQATLLLFGGKRLEKRIENLGFKAAAELMPKSKARFLFVVNKP